MLTTKLTRNQYLKDLDIDRHSRMESIGINDTFLYRRINANLRQKSSQATKVAQIGDSQAANGTQLNFLRLDFGDWLLFPKWVFCNCWEKGSCCGNADDFAEEAGNSSFLLAPLAGFSGLIEDFSYDKQIAAQRPLDA